MKNQRGQLSVFAETFNPANKNSVVTTGVHRLIGYLKSRTTIGEKRCAAETGLPSQANKAVSWPGGKAVRNILLLKRENIDRMVTGPTEGFEIVRSIVEAPQDQGGLK